MGGKGIGGSRNMLAFSFGFLEYWFFKTASNTPVSGATHAIKWHAKTIYLTDAQQLETDALFWGGVLLFLAAVAVNLRIKLFPN